MNKYIKKKSKRTNPILWFLFAIVIPLIVATVLTALVLMVAGFNVTGWVKEVGSKTPVVSTFITTEEEEEEQNVQERLNSTIKKQESEINSLNTEVGNLESMIEQLEKQIVQLERKNEEDEEILNKEEEDLKGNDELTKEVIASFRKMNKKQAAQIFQNLDDAVSIAILAELSNDLRGGILEAMDPKVAAKLTEKLFNQSKE